MTLNGFLQIGLFTAIILLITKPLGWYLDAVFSERPDPAFRIPGALERGIYKLAGVNPAQEQHWLSYAAAMLIFSLAGFVLLFGILCLQGGLPGNPQHLPGLAPDMAFNTAISFVTNTNWQAYVPETTMSYFSQMAGLTVQNFVSAASGMALALALIRGFARPSARGVGNFWVDLTRCTLYVLLPVAVLVSLFFVWQGVPQNFLPYLHAITLDGGRQLIAQGPVASQEAIKLFGTNGGGFFNANSAHPYENPTALSNLVQLVLIFSLGAGLTNLFGRRVGNARQGWAIFAVMGLLFLGGVTLTYAAESAGNPAFPAGLDQGVHATQSGGNMEGKDVRFGIAGSALYATVTTDASSGAVNAMHDSLTPTGGMVTLINMMLGEIIFGGVGTGLCSMLLFALLAVFISGLMVGRTPEYLGKKIEAREVKMAMLAILILPLCILGMTALASVLPAGKGAIANPGPHGFSEILYAFTSMASNNGSAFAGFSAGSPFYTCLGAVAMYVGRFLTLVPTLAIAGALAARKTAPASAGTFPTDGLMFVLLLCGVILIVGGLTYFPALALGPVADHLRLMTLR